MKAIILLLLFSLTTAYSLKSQYVIDFANPATYQVSCGSVTPSQWSVSKSTCELYLPPFVLASVSNFTVSYTFRINQSGNLTANDILTVYYKIGNQSAWVLDTALLGNVNNNVRTFSNSISITNSDTLFFKAVAKTQSNNGFWAIKSGDISIGNVRPIYFPLPVELSEFGGYHHSDAAVNHISWTTLSELNNDYFTLERSANGIDFEPIAMITGAGTSNEPLRYETIDTDVSGDLYYRLTQTDFDGAYKTYAPVFVSMKPSDEAPELIEQVWSNGNELNIVIPSGIQSDLQLELYLSDGRMLYRELLSADPFGMNLTRSITHADRGMIVVSVRDMNGNASKRKIMNP